MSHSKNERSAKQTISFPEQPGRLYPEGIKSWMVKLDAKPEGGMEIDSKFFREFQEGLRRISDIEIR
jgi:hypothetical protein